MVVLNHEHNPGLRQIALTSLPSALVMAFRSISDNPFFCAGSTFFLAPGMTSLRGPGPLMVFVAKVFAAS